MSDPIETPQFVLEFATPDELGRMLDSDLARGRAFVPGANAVVARTRCQLVLSCRWNDTAFIINAEAVWSDPAGAGVGLEFVDWSKQRARELRAMAECDAANGSDDPDTLRKLGRREEDGSEPPDLPEEPADISKPAGAVRRAPNVYERVRRLKPHEQQQLARHCGHAERVALERCFGGAVWEALLQNPQLTGPEVAMIAKKGSLPRPVLASITSNAAWLSVPEVQRALLSNPRLDPGAIGRVLRTMSRADLARIQQQTRYPARVRNEARRILNA